MAKSSVARMGGFFEAWPARKRLTFGLGLAVIVGCLVALAWWAQRTPKAVLFSDLAERDAAVLTAELDKLKQPYSLSEDGRAILVSADTVHRTRLALMGKQLPLHGVVGFELFNSADFGVSDFIQKVNYQRALQGELTRTILAIEQVRDARVHLALPDQTLFRKEGSKAKASVTVSLKGGQSLLVDQVAGIQRLIAASVPDIRVDDVTVLDQHGVVLSRVSGDEAARALGQLDARQSLEAHLTKKVARLLDQMFPPGDSMVAVDVVLVHEQSRITTEEVLGAPVGERSGQVAGVISRERIVTKEPPAELNSNSTSAGQIQTQETDYQTGKRTAQTVSQGGQISHLNVAVVVKQSLSEAELAKVRQLIATAVGLQPSRGDVVAVHSMSDLGLSPPATTASGASVEADAPNASAEVSPVRAGAADGDALSRGSRTAVVGAFVIALLAISVYWWARRLPAAGAAPPLNQGEREALLASIKQWLEPQA